MATPYNPFSPPPTAGPLPIIERANKNTPYSGGGGGGGPSTIVSTFNQLFTSSIGSADPANIDLEIIGSGANLKIDMSSGGLADIQFQLSTSVGSGGANAPSLACLDLGGQSYSFVLGAPAGVGLTTTISSLSVSSINGAAPGGSVPANLNLSTLNVAGLASVSSLTGVAGAPLNLDGRGQAINVAATALNVPAAPVSISTATISSINGLVPGAVSDPLSVSSLSVSSVNGGAPPSVSYSGLYATYNQGGKACTLGTTYFSLVNGIGQLVMTMPETPAANWAGGTKFIIFGGNFGGGTQGMPNTWNIDNVFISCPDGTGAYNLNSWDVASGGAQLNINTAVGGTPSTFAITAQVRF